MSLWHGDHRPMKRRMPSQPSAPIAQRHAVYSALLGALGLSERHRGHLTRERGLPAALLPFFATLPALSLTERKALAHRSAERAEQPVANIPAFYKDGASWALVPLPRNRETGFAPASGFLIAIPDHLGRIAGLTLRADDVPDGERRYTMLSSSGWRAGACSGTPAGVWRPDLKDAGCWVHESYLKALIAADRLGACSIGIAGVANWRPALEVLASAPPGYPVVIAYDVPDLATTLEVWRAREDLALALHARGFAVSVATWDGGRAKGIDDALLGGLPVEVEPWRPTLAPVVPPRSISLPAPERPAAVACLAVAR